MYKTDFEWCKSHVISFTLKMYINANQFKDGYYSTSQDTKLMEVPSVSPDVN